MASVNKVILVGNLGRDPEVRYTAEGSAITNISVATTSQWKDRNSGERREETEWHRVTFFGRLAEIAGEYLKKGRSVYIEGRLRPASTPMPTVWKSTPPTSSQSRCRCWVAVMAAETSAATAVAVPVATVAARPGAMVVVLPAAVPAVAVLRAVAPRQVATVRRPPSTTWTTTSRSDGRGASATRPAPVQDRNP